MIDDDDRSDSVLSNPITLMLINTRKVNSLHYLKKNFCLICSSLYSKPSAAPSLSPSLRTRRPSKYRSHNLDDVAKKFLRGEGNPNHRAANSGEWKDD